VPPPDDGEHATIHGSFQRHGFSKWEAIEIAKIDGQKVRPPQLPGTYKSVAEYELVIPAKPLTIAVGVHIRPGVGPIMIRGTGEILFYADSGHQYIVIGEVHRDEAEAIVWVIEAESEEPVSDRVAVALLAVDVSTFIPVIGPAWQ